MSKKEEYKLWCADKEDTLPLFLQPWLLDAVCQDKWDIALYKNKEQKIVGALPFFTFTKKMISVIGMPYLIPYMGMYLQYPAKQKQSSAYDFEKEVVGELIKQIPSSIYLQQKFYPDYTYGLPFYWQGYRLDWRYTYYLSLRQSESALWEGMEGSARTQLLKTLKQVTIEKSSDTKTMYNLVGYTFSKQNISVPYSYEEFDRMYQAIKRKECGDIYIAKMNDSGAPVAGMFMAKDNTTVYNLVLGRNHNIDPGGSIHGVLWQCILDHIDKHDTFDFEGSMLEGPERMFRSFGSMREPVLQVTRFKNRFWKSVFALSGR